ncbi:Conserved hypothetical protein [Herminiimonas arsenicoxydans]|uniref:Peptidase S1 domain-containing protein n=1 Tax=Herminiimonas arsenicoxydans TaxID=204773 RepID=A4G9G5_HERAR|nr:Conserved hypothetical protein [Herminiimonas arsenicoxydans]
MEASEVALALRAWAQENHLYKTEFPIELHPTDEAKDSLFDSAAMSVLAEKTLRSRGGITAIAFNNANNTVTVFTDKSVPAKEQKILPQAVLQQVEINYMHSGTAQAGVPANSAVPAPFSIHNGRYACGSSIHPAKVLGAGTLGCLVRDPSGDIFALTNNHVSGMCNYASNGEKIIAPGHPDIIANGIDPFTIGYHSRSLPMVHGLPDNVDIATNNDAALLKLSDSNLVCSMQGQSYDTPSLTFEMQAGFSVQKVGRTTGLTHGQIIGEIIAPHPVSYSVPGFGNHVSFFERVFAIHSNDPDTPFSQPGDSGSLVTTEMNGDRYAIGIVFAGNNQGMSFALPLIPILANLNVQIVSGHNI